MIPAGTTLTFVVSGHVSTWTPIEADPSRVEDIVTNQLMPFLTVKAVRVVPSTLALGGLLEYEYTASVAVATRVAHARAEDVTGWIVSAFYAATGQTARVLASDDPLAPTVPADTDFVTSITDALKGLLGGVQSTVTIVALAVVVVGGAYLWSKR